MNTHQQYDFNVVFLCKLFMRFMCNDVTLGRYCRTNRTNRHMFPKTLQHSYSSGLVTFGIILILTTQLVVGSVTLGQYSTS